MAADIRLADAGAAQTSLPIVVYDLPVHFNQYTEILILCSNGDRKYATGGGGAASTSFYTTPVQFTGLTPGHSYGFRVEAKRPGYAMEPIPANGTLRYFTTLDADANPPGVPTVSRVSVNGRTITWRVTAGANTTYIELHNDWGAYNDTAWVNTGQSQDFTYTLPNFNTQYSVRARGWNPMDGHGNFSGWSRATTGAEPEPDPIVVGSVGTVVTSNVGTSGFRLSWSAASNASSYQIQYRVDGSPNWTNSYATSLYTTALFIDITGLPEGIYYEYRVRGYRGDVFGSYSSIGRVRTDKTAPTDLNWPTFIAGTPVDALTAKRWNDLLSKINAWREYHGHPIGTFTTVFTGDIIRAALYNQAVNNISVLPVTTTLPQLVSVGTIITADRLNRLGIAIDSL